MNVPVLMPLVVVWSSLGDPLEPVAGGVVLVCWSPGDVAESVVVPKLVLVCCPLEISVESEVAELGEPADSVVVAELVITG